MPLRLSSRCQSLGQLVHGGWRSLCVCIEAPTAHCGVQVVSHRVDPAPLGPTSEHILPPWESQEPLPKVSHGWPTQDNCLVALGLGMPGWGPGNSLDRREQARRCRGPLGDVGSSYSAGDGGLIAGTGISVGAWGGAKSPTSRVALKSRTGIPPSVGSHTLSHGFHVRPPLPCQPCSASGTHHRYPCSQAAPQGSACGSCPHRGCPVCSFTASAPSFSHLLGGHSGNHWVRVRPTPVAPMAGGGVPMSTACYLQDLFLLFSANGPEKVSSGRGGALLTGECPGSWCRAFVSRVCPFSVCGGGHLVLHFCVFW